MNKALPLMQALQDGPVAVSVGASDWWAYSSGIFDNCPRDTVINHAVVMTGYGNDGEKGYWTIQNSWGYSWGEMGTIRILRGATPDVDDDHCGIDHKPED